MSTSARRALSLLALVFVCGGDANAVEEERAAPGKRMPSFALRDLDGALRKSRDFDAASGLVLVFTRVGGPDHGAYLARVRRLIGRFADEPVDFVLVDTSPHFANAHLRSVYEKESLSRYVLRDSGGYLRRTFPTEFLPKVFFFGAERRLRYSGPIGADLPEPGSAYLSEAIVLHLGGRPIPVAERLEDGAAAPR